MHIGLEVMIVNQLLDFAQSCWEIWLHREARNKLWQQEIVLRLNFQLLHKGCVKLFVQKVNADLRITISTSIKLCSDSKSAINIVNSPVQLDRMKHVRIDQIFIKNEMEEGGIKLCYIFSQDQKADILTKSLTKPSHENLRSKL